MKTLLQSIILIKDVTFTPEPITHSIEKGAELIYKMGGCIRPPIVERAPSEGMTFKYKLISGQFAMTCALLAREKYGIESINVFISESEGDDFAEALTLFS